MPVLVDASVLLRLGDPKNAHYAECHELLSPKAAVRHELCLCAQSIIEYWVVATRPLPQNGLELTTAEASDDLLSLRSFLPNVPEPPDVADRWLRLVTQHHVRGKPSHDARLAALMDAPDIRKLLTLNARDFTRFTGLQCVDLAELLRPTT